MQLAPAFKGRIERSRQVTPVTAAHIPEQPTSMYDAHAPFLVSIIINNYNYGRFLGEAIESALHQSYAHTEIIVVDDGSTDHSREVIARYGDRIIPVLKENGGQSSAFYAGFQQSYGKIIMFLDSDDLLLPHTAAAVAEAFEAEPGLSKVQYRLEIVDAMGNPTGGHTPPKKIPMPSGDLRRHTLLFPDDICSPPTSGNAFAASTLEQILPMPESPNNRTSADYYLLNLAPLFGPIASLTAVGGRYRVHGQNHAYTTKLDLRCVRSTISRTATNHQSIVRHAQQLGMPTVPRNGDDILSVTYLANRVASLKIDPMHHPVKGDTRSRLLWLGIVESSRRFDLPLRTRALFMIWFAAAVLGPARMTRWLYETAFFSEQSSGLNKRIHELAR
jgi:glycosyltransferase involved in cell wall biosynthesis